ncbi:MAG: ankyrin repeat domain-containing protein [Leptospira sp.]|nr:ankyrin repeat domain-containing protein [Leptospira sp.]
MKSIYYLILTVFLSNSLLATELDLTKIRDPKTLLEKVKRGFDVDAVRSSDGYTLLHFAAETGSIELTSELLQRGVTKNPTMHRGNTPLSFAINFEKKEIIRLLLDAGVDPNFKLGSSDYNRSHFHYYMIKSKKVDRYIFDLFIKKGANLETKDSFEETPLISVAQLSPDKKEHLQLLLSAKANVKAQARGGKTALMTAVYTQNPDFIRAIVAAGAPVDQKDSEGNTALVSMINMGAGVEGDKEKPNIMKILVELGANINEPNNDGNTALHASVIGHKFELLEFLCSIDANTHLANKKNVTALDQAIINQNEKATEILLKVEREINSLDKYGSTRLHSAVMNQRYDLIRLLLQAGANKEEKDKFGKTPLQLAESMKDAKAIELLESGP